jgi:hypothetical protein
MAPPSPKAGEVRASGGAAEGVAVGPGVIPAEAEGDGDPDTVRVATAGAVVAAVAGEVTGALVVGAPPHEARSSAPMRSRSGRIDRAGIVPRRV